MTRLSTVIASFALVACTPFSLSPPTRILPLESAATLDEGQAAAQIGGGFHDAIHHPSGFASANLAYAPAEGVELSVEGTYAYVDYRDERGPHLGAGRVGLKLAPIEHLSFVGGVGAGAGAHGAFISPDLGVIAAYENPYFVPWGAVRALASLPVDPNTITVTVDDPNSTPTSYELLPPETLGWQLSTGARLPIRIDDSTRLDLLAGVGLTFLYGIGDSTREHVFVTAGFGARMVIGG